MREALLGAAATLAVAALGWFLHRSRERVRWEEEAQGQLAKLRYGALIDLLKSVSSLYWWQFRTLDSDADVTKEERESASAEAAKAGVEIQRTFASQMFLIPHEVRVAIRDAIVGIGEAESEESLRRSAISLGDALEPYLPRMRRRRLVRAERMAIAARGWEEELAARSQAQSAPEETPNGPRLSEASEGRAPVSAG